MALYSRRQISRNPAKYRMVIEKGEQTTLV
jgi:hypothetical protein